MSILNKKPSNIEDCNQDSYIIDENNLDFNTVLDNMPTVLADTVRLLKTQFINISDTCILNCCILKFAQALTIKRPTFKTDAEDTNTIIPNWYSIIFMPSGYGKDELSNNLDRYFFKDVRTFFEEQEKNYIDNLKKSINEEAQKKYPNQKQETTRLNYIQKKSEEIRNLVLESTDGTQEGLFSDAKAFKNAGFGSITIKFSEFGSFIKTITTESEKYFNCLLDAYNGTLHSKTIQGKNREKDINYIPVNALFYSDSTIFKNQLKKVFDEFLTKGFARRSMISFQNQTNNLKHKRESKESTQQYLKEARQIKENILKTYNSLVNNSCFCFSSDAFYTTHQNYKKQCTNKHNKAIENINKSEIMSRPFKALKLACIYAILNHPTDTEIKVDDVKQAIISIEFLSKDLNIFGEYQKEIKTDYDLFFDFMKKNVDKEFSKTELRQQAKEYLKQNSETIGKRISNEYFNNTLDSYINFVSISAGDEGFIFEIQTKINNNKTYKLTRIKQLVQLENYKQLGNILTV